MKINVRINLTHYCPKHMLITQAQTETRDKENLQNELKCRATRELESYKKKSKVLGIVSEKIKKNPDLATVLENFDLVELKDAISCHRALENPTKNFMSLFNFFTSVTHEHSKKFLKDEEAFIVWIKKHDNLFMPPNVKSIQGVNSFLEDWNRFVSQWNNKAKALSIPEFKKEAGNLYNDKLRSDFFCLDRLPFKTDRYWQLLDCSEQTSLQNLLSKLIEVPKAKGPVLDFCSDLKRFIEEEGDLQSTCFHLDTRLPGATIYFKPKLKSFREQFVSCAPPTLTSSCRKKDLENLKNEAESTIQMLAKPELREDYVHLIRRIKIAVWQAFEAHLVKLPCALPPPWDSYILELERFCSDIPGVKDVLNTSGCDGMDE